MSRGLGDVYKRQQHNCLHQLWSALSTTEKDQLEQITRKLLSRLDQMEQDGVVLEAMS